MGFAALSIFTILFVEQPEMKKLLIGEFFAANGQIPRRPLPDLPTPISSVNSPSPSSNDEAVCDRKFFFHRLFYMALNFCLSIFMFFRCEWVVIIGCELGM